MQLKEIFKEQEAYWHVTWGFIICTSWSICDHQINTTVMQMKPQEHQMDLDHWKDMELIDRFEITD